MSSFPKLDFAAKYVAGMPYSLQGLGNAGTGDAVNKLRERIFVGAARASDEMVPPIVFSADGNIDTLVPNKLYT